MTMQPLILNVGAGDKAIPGFISLDAKFGEDILELPYADNSVDGIYASHVVEHVYHRKIDMVFREFARVLKPGGWLKVAVPDLDIVYEQSKRPEMPPQLIDCVLFGSYEGVNKHGTHFTFPRLTAMLKSHGFDNIVRHDPAEPGGFNGAGVVDCSAQVWSLNVSCTKRIITIKPDPKVVMVLTGPRLAFRDFSERLIETVRQLGWVFISSEGAEWGKGLTSAVKKAMSMGADYIMTLDYDSVFDPEDCREMLRLLQTNPSVGVVIPIQAHRHRETALGCLSPNPDLHDNELTDVDTGHFGCTMVRREVFEAIPKPWFMSLPDPVTGEWDNDGQNTAVSLDADIHFWLQCRTHGFRVCMANRVQIGHMEIGVKWMGENGCFWQTIQSYRKAGKPKKAVFNAAAAKLAKLKSDSKAESTMDNQPMSAGAD